MKRRILLYLLCFLSWSLAAQRFDWSLSLNHFFDNTEFEGSSYQHPQTMAGVWLDPEVGLDVDSFHHLHTGVNLLKEYGTSSWMDKVNFISYFAYRRNPLQFVVGSFPREKVTRSFSRAFFQDSIYFYRPTMTGMWWHYGREHVDAGLFLDWTGKKSGTEHEAFFVGGTGTISHGVCYATLQALLRHHAASEVVRGVHENALCQAAVGLDLTQKTALDTLSVQFGWLFGFQRDRTQTADWSVGNGLICEARMAWKGLGMETSWYAGGGLMPDYSAWGNKAYWGDPFYAGSLYGRTDVMYDFFRSRPFTLRLVLSHHFSEKHSYFEQSLVGKITFDRIGR